VVIADVDATIPPPPHPPYYILPHISCSSVPLSPSFGLTFSRTVLYITYSGLSKERRPLPSFYSVATPFSALCLPALIRLNLLLVGLAPFGLCVFHSTFHDNPDIPLYTFPWAM